ncbi:LOW QUALITY PROTEIN: zinc finger protein 501-like [Atheta coriaria]|uniref:LOW QUALITY PROTEIN: zinc finger protein 501-like n=1 Tax=Dalotia coriaria TaxID=877792 RepID=UPI0031F46B19
MKITRQSKKIAAATNNTSRSRRFQCATCQKRFLSRNDLRKHERIHTDERPYVCEKCNMGFRQCGSLKNHMASKHNEDLESPPVFICNYCHKAFPIKERLRLHLRTHTGVKPYQCKHCDKTFARGGQLVQHERTHTGERPYKCKYCSADFTCPANLKLHQYKHQDVRNFVCDICGKSFIRRDALRKHLNCFHNNIKAFRCEICKKDFKGHLPQHMRTHQNDKPHGCAICQARFAQRSQLTVHQRIHSGEKPYRCKVCWKAFAHSTALKLHIRQHTGEKPFECLLCKNVFFTQLPHLKKHMRCIHKTDKPYLCVHCKTFHKTKSDLENHAKSCRKTKKAVANQVKPEEVVQPPMTVEKMRLLLAILLQRISTPEKLEELGFNKKLIDEVLIESLKNANKVVCNEEDISDAERLKRNIRSLLEWTVPNDIMEKFQQQHRSTEELLEELTS